MTGAAYNGKLSSEKKISLSGMFKIRIRDKQTEPNIKVNTGNTTDYSKNIENIAERSFKANWISSMYSIHRNWLKKGDNAFRKLNKLSAKDKQYI